MKLCLPSFVLLALVTTSCVHTQSTIPFHEEDFKDPYFALVYVYREASVTGGDVSWGVFLDENVVGRLRQDAYLTVHAAPGTHAIYVGGNASRSTTLYGGALGAAMAASANSQIKAREFKAKSGETYYLRCKGYERNFLTRDQAIDTLRTMKYDQGN